MGEILILKAEHLTFILPDSFHLFSKLSHCNHIIYSIFIKCELYVQNLSEILDEISHLSYNHISSGWLLERIRE